LEPALGPSGDSGANRRSELEKARNGKTAQEDGTEAAEHTEI